MFEYGTLLRREEQFSRIFSEFPILIDKDRYAPFRNMVAGESKGTYHEVSSVSELQSALQFYNEYASLSDVAFDQFVDVTFGDIYENAKFPISAHLPEHYLSHFLIPGG